jgi:hypothetical protein
LERRVFLTTCFKVVTAVGAGYLVGRCKSAGTYPDSIPPEFRAAADWIKGNKTAVQLAATKNGIETNPPAGQRITANHMPAVMLEDSGRYVAFQETLIEQAAAATAPADVMRGLAAWNKVTIEGRATRAQKKYTFDVLGKLITRVDSAGLEQELDQAIKQAPDATNSNVLGNMRASLTRK